MIIISKEIRTMNVLDTIAMYTKLGFYIHPGKSYLNPTQEITYLGFVLNSITMSIKLTTEKASTINVNLLSKWDKLP